LTSTAEALAVAAPSAPEVATSRTPSISSGSGRLRFLVFSVPILALLALLYAGTFRDLMSCWWNDASYSHGFLVPLLSIWLAVRWYRRARPTLGEGMPALGLAELLAGCVVHAAAEVVASAILDFLGLGLVLHGLAWTIGGRAWARGLRFPIAFLFFMFPLPSLLTSATAVWLQDVVSKFSAELLNATWVCHRQGNALYLPGLAQPLYVAEECSGLRQLVAFAALSMFLGAWQDRRVWQRLVLLAAAIPAAIVANVLRVVLMAFGARWFGTSWLSGWMHDVPALITLPVGLGLLLLASWGLHRVAPGRTGKQ
jgi:exosortase